MYLLGLLYVLVFVATLILMAWLIKRLSRAAVDLGSESGRSFSRLAFTSRLLTAASLIPAVITAFAYVAALFWDDKLVLRLGTVATVVAFAGILFVLASTVLLLMSETGRDFPRGTRRKLAGVNLVGLVSCIVVIRIFWQWFPHW